jgi:hypothetical protein
LSSKAVSQWSGEPDCACNTLAVSTVVRFFIDPTDLSNPMPLILTVI